MSKILSIILAVIVIGGAGAYAVMQENKNDNGSKSGSSLPEWTFMVYLDADNNLESAGIDDFNEMETVGSNAQLNIIVQFDRAKGQDTSNGDWTNTRRYYVTKDNDTSTIHSVILENMTEQDMGDPQTLTDFVLWTMQNYPAQHYLLSLWDHGGGIRGCCWDDGSDGDNLDLPDLKTAFTDILNVTHQKIDIIGFDACLMGGVSIHYQLNPFADIIVASEATESNDGWPYDLILSDIAKDPTIDPETVARKLVEHYVESYGTLEPWVTQAAFRTEEMKQVFHDIDTVADILKKNLPLYEASIADSRENTESYDLTKEAPYMPEMSGYPMCDLWDFLDQLKRPEHGTAFDEELMNATMVLKNSISAARIAYGSGTDEPHSHGLSIYFPQTNNTGTSTYSPIYDKTDYAHDHQWDDFLKAYYLD